MRNGSGPSAAVVVFTRIPLPGSSKTRLIPLLGDQGAAELQREMTEHVVRQALIAGVLPLDEKTRGGKTTCQVRATDGFAVQARRWLGVEAVDQGEGNLGERLRRGASDAFARHDAVALIGGDCPTVSASTINRALRYALESGAAIVPAADGGYCLLALRSDLDDRLAIVFSDIAWGTPTVFRTSVERLRAVGIEPVILDTRRDVDEPDDVPVWQEVRDAWVGSVRTISVVIPALDESGALPATLAVLGARDVEVIVVDGGSEDATCAVAEAAGAVVVRGVRGRAAQMNAGARIATGDALVFLHADTLLPLGWSDEVRRALDPSSPGERPPLLGAFAFDLDLLTPALAVVRLLTRLRGRLAHLPYGDQALFCRSATFAALGGFPDYPVMEDYEFVDRCRRAGEVRVISASAVTSARRWTQSGAWRWTGLNIRTVHRYRRGDSPEELAVWRRAQSNR